MKNLSEGYLNAGVHSSQNSNICFGETRIKRGYLAKSDTREDDKENFLIVFCKKNFVFVVFV